MKDFARLAAFGCLTFLLFFRPGFAFSAFGNLDPQCYLSQLHGFLGLRGPACESSAFLPGTAMLWLPGGAFALLVSKLTGAGADSLIRLSVGVTSFLLWFGSLLLIQGILADKPRRAALWILCVPVLYYAAIRTMLSHSAEFFLACLAAWSVTRRRFPLALTAAALLSLVRYNDLPWLFIIGAAAWGTEKRVWFWTAWSLLSAGFTAFALHVGLFAGYHEVRLPFLASSASFEKFVEVFSGTEWGLFWMSPWWVLVLAAAVWHWRKLTPFSGACAAAMAASLALCVSWRGNGGDFGYRYLIGTFPAALLLWKEWEPALPKWKLPARVALVWGAGWTTYLTWLYRTQPEFTPEKFADAASAVIPDFQWSALLAFFDPARLAAPFSHGPIPALWSGSLVRGQWWGLALLTAAAAGYLIFAGNRSRLRQ